MPNIETQKVTVVLPKALLENAQKITGKGIIETVIEALELLLRSKGKIA